MPDKWAVKCASQSWTGAEIRSVAEGKGIFSTKEFEKNEVVCNYGGKFLSEEYATQHLLPFEEKCNYLIEIQENVNGKLVKFFLNHDESTESIGKYLNHSKLHANLRIRIFATKDNKLDVLFLAKKKICSDVQLLWDYGKSFMGVEDCVKSCQICRKKSGVFLPKE